MIPLSTIEKTFSRKERVSFKELPGEMIVIELDTPLVIANLSLYGGQVLRWRPKIQTNPVLWASNLVRYLNSKVKRAGIPICWPWRGVYPTQQNLPGYRYAQITNCRLVSIDEDGDGVAEVRLILGNSDLRSSHWRSEVSFELKVTIGTTLDIELTTHNKGMQEI